MTDITHDQILQQYAGAPDRLEAAVAGLTDAQLDLGPGPGSWTIRQIVHHIVDGDDLWQVALKAALGNGNGVFTLAWYWEVPQDTWAEAWKYAERPIGPSLALFRANRRHVVDLLEHVPDAWDRCIRIQWLNEPEERASAGEILASQARHASGHIDQILDIRRAHHLA